MYYIQWTNGDGCLEACAADNKAAWEIYWALKKLYEGNSHYDDCWIMISRGGCFLNPRGGSALPLIQDANGDPHIKFKQE